MIDIEAIKNLPDKKPRKGPHRLGKSTKSKAQARYKAEQSARRRRRHTVTFSPQETQPINPEISVASGVFPIVRRVYCDLVARQLVSVQPMPTGFDLCHWRKQ